MYEIIKGFDLSHTEQFAINLQEDFSEICKCWKIEVGNKYQVRDFVLKEWQENQDLNKRFKLVPKRLNRWWYSVYIRERCKFE